MEFLSSETTVFPLECAGTDSLGSEDNKRDGKTLRRPSFKRNVVFQFAVVWTMRVCPGIAGCPQPLRTSEAGDGQ